MPNCPACRARHLKQSLASVDRLAPAAAARIRAGLDDQQLRDIEDASGVEWLPLELSLRLASAIHGTLGEEGLRRFHRGHFVDVFRGPVYAAVVQGALAVYGFDPARWARLLPHGWTLTFRNCGSWTVEPEDHGVVPLRLHDLPRACVAARAWPLSVGASVSAVFDVAGHRGSVELVSVDAIAREVRFEMRWAGA